MIRLLPLLAESNPTALGWAPRPAFAERAIAPAAFSETEDPDQVESFAVVYEGWKLIKNTTRPEGWPEYELFDHAADPLNAENVAEEHPEVVEQLSGYLEKWHEAARREIDTYCDDCVDNDNRVVEEMHKSLKPKKWFVALHEEHLEREAAIDKTLHTALSKHKGTYLYGLSLKVKALQKEDDPAAVDLIEAEVDKVNEDEEYFRGLMLDPGG